MSKKVVLLDIVKTLAYVHSPRPPYLYEGIYELADIDGNEQGTAIFVAAQKSDVDGWLTPFVNGVKWQVAFDPEYQDFFIYDDEAQSLEGACTAWALDKLHQMQQEVDMREQQFAEAKS